MSFSKAQIKRFNESGGCAPPPGAYNPKFDESQKGCVFDKSNRFPNQKVEDFGSGGLYSSSSLSDFNFVTPRPIGKSSSKKWTSSTNVNGKLGFKSSSNYELSKPSYDEIRHENLELQEKLNILTEEKEKEIEHLNMMIGANEETCKLLYGQIMEGDKQKITDKDTIESLLQKKKEFEEMISKLKVEISSKNNKIKKIQQKFEKLNKSTEEMENRTSEISIKHQEIQNEKVELQGKLDILREKKEKQECADKETIDGLLLNKKVSEEVNFKQMSEILLKNSMIDEMEQKVEKLNKSREEMETRISELNLKYEEIRHENLDLQEKMDILREEKEREIEDLVLEGEKQKLANNEIIDDLLEKKKKSDEFKSKLLSEILLKNSMIEEIEQNVEKLNKSTKEMENQISELSIKYQKIQKEKVQLQEKMDILREKKEKQEFADKETIDGLLLNKKVSEEVNLKQMSEILLKNSIIDEMEQKVEKLNKSREEMENRISELNYKINELEETNSNIILDTNKKIEELLDDNSSLCLKLDDLNDQMDKEKINFNSMITANQETIQYLEDQIFASENKQFELEDCIKQLEQKVFDLNENKMDLSSKLSATVSKHETLLLNHDEVLKEKTELYEKLTDLIEVSDAEMTRLNSLVASNNDQIQLLEKRIDESDEIKIETEKMISQLNSKIKELEGTNSSLILDTNTKLDQMENVNCELNMKINDLTEELKKEKADLHSIISRNEEIIQTLQNQVIEVEKRRSDYEDLVDHLNLQITQLDKENSTLDYEISELSSRYEIQLLTYDDVVKEKLDLSGQLEQFRADSIEEKVQLNAIISGHEEQIRNLEVQISEGEKKSLEDQDLIKHFKSQCEETNITLGQMENVNNELNVKINDLQEELKKEKADLHSIINENEETIQSLQIQITQIESQRAEFKEMIDDLNLQITQLDKENSHLTFEISDLSSRYEIQLLTYDDVVKEKLDLSGQLDQFRADSIEEKIQLNAIISGHEEQIQNLKMQISEGEKKSLEDQDLINHLKSQCKETNISLDQMENVNNELNVKINDLHEELKKEKADLHSIINENEETIQSLQIQITQIESQRAEFKEMTEDLNLQITQFDKENSNLTFEISDLSSRYAILLLTHEEIVKEKMDLDEQFEQFKIDSIEENVRLDSVISGHEEQIQNLESQVSDGEKKSLKDQDLIGHFKSQISELEQTNCNIILDTNNKMKELGDTNSDLCLKLDDLKEEMDKEKINFNMKCDKDQDLINHFKSQFEKSLKEIYELRALTMSLKSLEMKVKSAQHLVKKEAEKHSRITFKYNELNDKLFQQAEINNALSEERNFEKSNYENGLNAVKFEAQEEIRRLESKVSELESLIGPFKSQLMCYEEEMRMDRDLTTGKESYYKEMADKYAQILGHQNSRQKIHHVIKLKEDLLKNRKDKEDLQKEVVKLKKALADSQRLTSNSRRFDPKKAFSTTNPSGAAVLQQNNEDCN